MLNCFKTKKFKLLLAMISLLVLTNSIQESYAKYISSASSMSNFTIAQWTFIVNNQDVLENEDFSSTIVPVIDSNSNIKDGVIAPTSTGHFDINIDFSNVEVAFKEEVSITQDSETNVSDLVLTGYSVNGGPKINIAAGDKITVNHALDDTSTTDNYRFFVEWVDGDGETMDNEADTEASEDGIAKVKVNLNFIQLAN